jgi:hypothetical protein
MGAISAALPPPITLVGSIAIATEMLTFDLIVDGIDEQASVPSIRPFPSPVYRRQ